MTLQEAITAQLGTEEGLKLHPYTDTVGKLTIGYGRNLTDAGITYAEAQAMLQHDVDRTLTDCAKLPFWGQLSQTRQVAVADLMFNLGATQFRLFTTFMALMLKGEYAAAALDLKQTAWATQVQPSRASRIVSQITNG